MTAPDPYRYFRIEAREILDDLGRGVLRLEDGVPEEGLVSRLLRLAHTLKGAARVVRQGGIADAAHAIEELLAPHREGSEAVPRSTVEALLAELDRIGAQLARIETPAAPASPEEPVWEVHTDADDLDVLVESVVETSVQVRAMRGVLDHLARARLLAEPGTHADLHEALRTLERDLSNRLDRLDGEVAEARSAAERLKLVPARTLFSHLERTARDVGRTLGRGVAFEATGGEVRVEGEVLRVIRKALVQLVRNAVAHGLEPEAERRSAGKPPVGRVEIEVQRLGSRVRFSCRDDGRGVDVDAVTRAARARGHSGDGDVLSLLLEGGLTTSQAVTQVAGRGVGLDVVRETVAQLGGRVSLQTEPGRGAGIAVEVPVSTSAFEALLVRSNGGVVVLPLDGVRGTLRVDEAAAGDGEVVHDGRTVPFLPLEQLLDAPPRAIRPWTAVLVEAGGALAALGVDRLLGIELVVARPLPDLAAADPVVAGASLDGAGLPRLVLDPDALVGAALRHRPPSPAAEVPIPPILVVDDSLTTRMLEQSILESAGYEVDLASSGEEALVKVRARRYGLLLVDVEMPGMSGLQFLEHLRADPDLRDVPAIVVSSRASAEDLRRGEQAGASAYVVKSEFNQDRLLATIRRLLD